MWDATLFYFKPVGSMLENQTVPKAGDVGGGVKIEKPNETSCSKAVILRLGSRVVKLPRWTRCRKVFVR